MPPAAPPSSGSRDNGLRQWQGHALVVGCGGIGQALLADLAWRAPGLTLWATSHSGWRPEPGGHLPAERLLPLDLTDDGSLARFSLALQTLAPSLRLVFNTAGLLHGDTLQPEKRLQQVNRQALERLFAVNAFGPLLLARAVEPLLDRTEPVLFASLSARVGSIADNQLGGWYGYRGPRRPRTSCCVAWRWSGGGAGPWPASPSCTPAPPPPLFQRRSRPPWPRSGCSAPIGAPASCSMCWSARGRSKAAASWPGMDR